MLRVRTLVRIACLVATWRMWLKRLRLARRALDHFIQGAGRPFTGLAAGRAFAIPAFGALAAVHDFSPLKLISALKFSGRSDLLL
jgi:hypothetical protein